MEAMLLGVDWLQMEGEGNGQFKRWLRIKRVWWRSRRQMQKLWRWHLGVTESVMVGWEDRGRKGVMKRGGVGWGESARDREGGEEDMRGREGERERECVCLCACVRKRNGGRERAKE
eukprot:3992745-Pleurochrysis_carterae.AAC.1